MYTAINNNNTFDSIKKKKETILILKIFSIKFTPSKCQRYRKINKLVFSV